MNKTFLTVAAAAVAVGMTMQSQAISLDIVNVSGNTLPTSAHLTFDGAGNFTFDDASSGAHSGYDFVVNGITGGVGDSFGLAGNITGTFTIGVPSGSPESATVTSSAGATLSIFDGSSTFSGSIDWIALTRDGTSGDLNISGLVNLTGITYAGTVQDLIDLMGDANQASATISFSFNPAKSINDLRTAPAQTSYSGDLTSVPDGGTTVMLLGAALSSLGLIRRKLVA